MGHRFDGFQRRHIFLHPSTHTHTYTFSLSLLEFRGRMRALIYRHRYRAFSASVWVHFSDRRRETGNKRSTEGGWRERRRRRRDSLDARLKVQRSLVVGLPTRIADRGASCRIQVRTAKRAENRLWTFPPSRWLMSRFETPIDARSSWIIQFNEKNGSGGMFGGKYGISRWSIARKRSIWKFLSAETMVSRSDINFF